MEINKDLIAASSTPIVLAILSEGDSYGYAILQRVRELSGGRMEWTDGMLYPVLHRLERLGFVEARWEKAETGRRRKYYRITPRGQMQLAEERKQWQAVDETLRGIWRRMALPLADGAMPATALLAAAPIPVRATSLDPRCTAIQPRRARAAHSEIVAPRDPYPPSSPRTRHSAVRTLPFPLPALPAAFRTLLLQAA